MYTDIKCVIFAIACVLGYVSHMVCKFPRDYLEVAACVAVYGFLMTVHYYIESYLEKDAFFISKSHEVSGISKGCNIVNLVETIQELPESPALLDSEPRLETNPLLRVEDRGNQCQGWQSSLC